MAATIDSIATSARADLDTAYEENNELDFEAVKASIISSRAPDSENKDDLLELASLTPDELIIENTDVYAEIEANCVAIIQAALDDEQSILQGE